MSQTGTEFDFEKFRLRRFIERLDELGEVETHAEAVPLTGLSTIIEKSQSSVVSMCLNALKRRSVIV